MLGILARAGGILIVAAAISSAAVAQELPAAEPEPAVAEARGLYEQGLRAIDEARWADALGLFRRSYELSAAPPALFNVALVLRAVGRIRDARDALVRLIEQHPDADESIRSLASLMHAGAAARVAAVTLEDLPRDTRMRLRVDGAPFASAPARTVRLEIDPGRHTVAVLMPGYEVFEWRGWVGDGAQQRVRVRLEETGGPLWPWLVAGGVALAVAVTVIVLVLTTEDSASGNFDIDAPRVVDRPP